VSGTQICIGRSPAARSVATLPDPPTNGSRQTALRQSVTCNREGCRLAVNGGRRSSRP
jgi:hypothetical protein